MTSSDTHPTTNASESVDWTRWLSRWDAQQQGYLPYREERFQIMLDILAEHLPPNFVALDLACGPGSLSQRILERFPNAQTIGIDTDPVLLAMGQGALGDAGGRMKWLKDDLTDASWIDRVREALAGQALDAVVSSTALHWLAGDVLTRVYWQLGATIRSGGVFMNADHMRFGPGEPTLAHLTETLTERRHEASFTGEGVEDWETWWASLRAEPSLEALFAEREARFAWRDRVWIRPGYALHVGALKEAGFREVGVVWQHLYNRVVLAIR